jgi:hypothetical protein
MIIKQGFLQSVSGTGDYRHQPAPTGTNRPRPALPQTGLDRTGPVQDRPVLFYDVFNTYFVLKGPKRYDILKILIKYVIEQLGPVDAGLVPVQSGLCRCRLVAVWADRCGLEPAPEPVPVVPDAIRCRLTDRKKRYIHIPYTFKNYK